MQNTLIESTQFQNLKHGEMGHIAPTLLSDFKFGNQRGERDKDRYAELRQNVKRHGVTQPVAARFNPEQPDTLELIFGHGRRDAAIDESLDSVPFIFYEVDDQHAFEMHLGENLQREDLDIVAKAQAAKAYLTHFKGDYEATASKLTMKVKALRELLELNKLTQKVLEAIRAQHISPAHGYVLAPFPHSAQDKNLDKIIAEGWTVQTLKERAGKAKIPLERAKFDTEECQGCEFNTAPQMDWLDGADAKAMCAKVACFQAKTRTFLVAQKEALTEQYGTILLLSETSESGCRLVSADVVGEAQFDTCTGCDNKVTIMDDRYGKEGGLTHDQCVDNVCFTKCRSAFTATVKAVETQVAHDPNVPEGQRAEAAKAVAQKQAKPSGKATLSNAVVNHYKDFLRKVAADHYDGDNRFMACLLTAALVHQTRFSNDTVSSHGFVDALVTCLTLDNEQRQAVSLAAAKHFLFEAKTDASNNALADVLIKCLKKDKDTTVPVIVQAWEPTQENLSPFTIKQLGLLAKAAGLEAPMEAKAQGSFARLTKGKKGEAITAMQAVEHDWSQFIPKSLISMVQ